MWNTFIESTTASENVLAEAAEAKKRHKKLHKNIYTLNCFFLIYHSKLIFISLIITFHFCMALCSRNIASFYYHYTLRSVKGSIVLCISIIS